MHVIAFDDGARVGAGRAGSAVGTGTVLRRWSVVVVQGVGDDPRLVVVPFGVADHEVTAAVCTRVPEGAVLGVHAIEGGVAVGAGPDVEGAVPHVAGVALVDAAGPPGVADEDPVLGHRRVGPRVERRRGREVVAPVRRHARLAAAVAAVPPDPVAAAASAAQEVAHRQVLHVDAVGLDLDAVAPAETGVLNRGVVAARLRRRGSRAGDDDVVAVHPPHADARRRDQDAVLRRPRLVVHAGRDEHRVTGAGGGHGRLDGAVPPCNPVERADEQGMGRRRLRRPGEGERGRQCEPDPAGQPQRPSPPSHERPPTVPARRA